MVVPLWACHPAQKALHASTFSECGHLAINTPEKGGAKECLCCIQPLDYWAYSEPTGAPWGTLILDENSKEAHLASCTAHRAPSLSVSLKLFPNRNEGEHLWGNWLTLSFHTCQALLQQRASTRPNFSKTLKMKGHDPMNTHHHIFVQKLQKTPFVQELQKTLLCTSFRKQLFRAV